jgi:succinoglycan biosynthesis transport protein ExoP
MNLIEFLRLIKKNIILLIIIPLVMASSTYFFTKNAEREFTSSAMIYTGLSTGFNIESTGESRKDQFVVNNSFENILNTIKSRETMREVSFKLLSEILILKKPDGKHVNPKTFEKLKQWIPDEIRKSIVVTNNAAATYNNLQRAYEQEKPKKIRELFNDGNSPFSLKNLSDIKAVRKGSSDMIELSYTLTDKGLCENTLKLFLEVFIIKYKGLKVSETGNVVEYFQDQLATAKKDLNMAEDRMKTFSENGQIINYYEQTKALAGKKEDVNDEQNRLVGELDAADNALRKLEEKLAINRESFFKNTELLNQKEKIASLSSEIAKNSLNPSYSIQEDLSIKVKQHERLLSEGVKKLYERTHSTENVQIKNLLDSWLENMILVEKNRARVKVLDKRMYEIKKDYSRFAPLGSSLSRLEREIDVHERAYIQILHDLNTALLRKQNIELSSKLNVIDKPLTIELPSKKMMLVILSALIGFIGILAGLVVLEITDQTIKTVERGIEMIGLDAVGALPVLAKNNVFHQQITQTLVGQIVTNIKMKINPNESSSSTPLILISSTQPLEGKSFIGDQITSHLEKSGALVLLIQPGITETIIFEDGKITYPETKFLSELKDISELIVSEIDPSDYDYCLLELPSLLSGNVPTQILKNANISILTVAATRSWKKADRNAVQILQNYNLPVEILVNGVAWESLENQVSEKEMSNPKWKIALKRLFRLEFNKKELFYKSKN